MSAGPNLLTFNRLLASAGIDPAGVVLMRHTPIEPAFQKVLPWVVAERPDLYLVYQQIQWKAGERAMVKADRVATFVGMHSGEATFAGLFRILGSRPLDYAGYWAVPGQRELHQLGTGGRQPDDPDTLIFDIEAEDSYRDWVGKLVVDWPATRTWVRWAERADPRVRAITEESRFVRGMPPWEELVLSWSQLSALPASWRASLAQWRGVYFIFDQVRRAGYVGSAYGADNILGRWLAYAATGHGGNRQLREGQPADLQFSILQRTSPDLSPDDVIRVEGTWKERLHTREFGLNSN